MDNQKNEESDSRESCGLKVVVILYTCIIVLTFVTALRTLCKVIRHIYLQHLDVMHIMMYSLLFAVAAVSHRKM